MQFKTKVTLTISALMFLSLTIFGFFSYIDTKKNSVIQVESSIQMASRSLSDYIDLWISSKKDVVDATARSLSTIASLSEDEIKTKLQETTKTIGGVDSFIGFENGKMLYGSGAKVAAGFDPRTRPWYTAAKTSKQAGASDAFISSSTKNMLLPLWHLSFTMAHLLVLLQPISNWMLCLKHFPTLTLTVATVSLPIQKVFSLPIQTKNF